MFTLSSGTEVDNEDALKESLQPLFAFLRALVLVEAVSLKPNGGQGNNDGSSQSDMESESRYRQTTFYGVDCSSTHPPVDRVVGSNEHQYASIATMVEACQQIRDLRGGAVENKISCLGRMIQFLETSFVAAAPIVPTNMSIECAEAISPHYSALRVIRAAQHYKTDFEMLQHRLGRPNSPSDETSCLLVEKRLAEFIGQAVRYYLRLFFNPAPPMITTDNESYDEDAFSKVNQHVKLLCATEGEEVDDSNISALVSQGLLRLHEYFGFRFLLSPDNDIPADRFVFCAKPASNRNLPVRAKTLAHFTDVEVEEILSDVRQAMGFLAATKACRFLIDLLTKVAVKREIERFGGWSTVESYAVIARNFECWRLCPHDAHLVLLCDTGALLNRLRWLCGRLEKHFQKCEQSVAALSKRFHTTTKSKNLLKNYPHIRTIAQLLSESQERVDAFPLVKTKRSKSAKGCP